MWLYRDDLDKIIERSAASEAALQTPLAPQPPEARRGYGQPWEDGYRPEHGGGHARRRGFLGGLFDD